VAKAPDPAGPRPGEPAATLLDLQSRAGNAAVGGLLAGEGPTALRRVIQRDEATPERTATKGAGGDGAKPAVAMLASPALKGPVPLQSFSYRPGKRPVGGSSGGSEGTGQTGGDVSVSIRLDDFDPALQSAAMKGGAFETMTISAAGGSYILDNVVVAGVSYSEESVFVTLNCTSLKFVS